MGVIEMLAKQTGVTMEGIISENPKGASLGFELLDLNLPKHIGANVVSAHARFPCKGIRSGH